MKRFIPTMTELVYWCAVSSAVAGEALLEHHGVSRREARRIVALAREQDFTTNGLDVVEDGLKANGVPL